MVDAELKSPGIAPLTHFLLKGDSCMLPAHKQEKKQLHRESGFTLLEIIAVLVILSILAVVALPKYFNLQNQARDKAMKSAVAEALGRVNGYFAQQVLSGSLPDEIDYSRAGALGTTMGDFTLAVGANGGAGTGPFTITVTGIATEVASLPPRVVTVQRPGY